MGKGVKNTFELASVLEEVNRFLADHDMAISPFDDICFSCETFGLPKVRLTITQVIGEPSPTLGGGKTAEASENLAAEYRRH